MACHAILFGGCLGYDPHVRFVAILALHVHVKVHLVFPDLRYTGVTPQTVHIVRLDLARCVGLVAFIAIELHGGFFIKPYLICFLNSAGFWREEPHIHSALFSQLFLNIFISAVAIEALPSSRLQVFSTIGMAVDASKSAHALAVY